MAGLGSSYCEFSHFSSYTTSLLTLVLSEGTFTTLVALLAWMAIPDWPETAKFLTEDERTMVLSRLSVDNAGATMNRLDKAAAKRIFTDWKIYINILMFIPVANSSYGFSFFTPTIINEMGFQAEAAQIRSIPVFVVAAILTIATAYLSDRTRHRFSFVIGGIFLATAGYGMLLAYDSVPVGAKYAALFFIVSGGFIAQTAITAWSQNNVAGHYKRSMSAAMMVGFGNCGGISASNIYITGERPQYPTGLGVSLALLWVCVAASTVFVIGMRRENKRRDRGERDHLLDGPEGDNLGDDHPNFRYTF
jgi:predicted MFS family arabinose efflux permease